MNGDKFLFDTNTVIYYLTETELSQSALGRLENICRVQINISVITKLELLGFNFLTKEDEYLAKEFISGSNVYQINPQIEDETIQLRKDSKIKLPDAVIAATAISHNFTLITRNFGDFKTIAKLNIVNPFDW